MFTRIKFCFNNNKIIASVLLLVCDVWEGISLGKDSDIEGHLPRPNIGLNCKIASHWTDSCSH